MPRLLITGGTVLTLAEERPQAGGAVLVEDGAVVEVAPAHRLSAAGAEVIDASGCVVMPGLINAHTHLFQTLIRGYADGRPFTEWLRRIYGVGRAIAPEDCLTAARLGALESLRGGVTTLLEHHFVHPSLEHPAATIEGLQEAGIRAVVARTSMDSGDLVPQETAETPEAAARASEAFLRRFAGRPRLSLMLGPSTPPINASAELVQAMSRVAREHGVPVTTHCAENRAVVARVRALGAAGVVDLFERLGVLEPGWLLSHCVHTSSDEIGVMRARGAAVAHNPVSNMYLGDGIAPVVAYRAAGIPVALGTDGPASNNTLDMFETMKAASLLQRVAALDAAAIRPVDAVRMATAEGARALGLEHLVGTLEPGKRADLIVVDMDRPHLVPLHDVYAQLVYCARAADVRDTIVDGRVVMRRGVVQTLDHASIMADARAAGRRLALALAAPGGPG
jgi:5-methylthioadenosine/S-adenosylhomocysteine deaminase